MTCRHGPDAMMQTCILCAAAQTRAEQAERDARLVTHLTKKETNG